MFSIQDVLKVITLQKSGRYCPVPKTIITKYIYVYFISIYFFNLELLLPPQKSLVAKLFPPTLLTSWYYYIVKFHIKIAVRLFSLPETLLLSFNEGAASFSRGACAGIDQTIYIP